jgi:tripeptidyl-peptidase-2
MRTAAYTIASILVTCSLIALQSHGDEPAPFPIHGLMPKREIGADKLLAQHPDYDGRGVVVAVFDTGVDPGAAGLQTTSDGKPKVLDVIDATGSGDVDTSTVVDVSGNTVEGLSGRTLKLDPKWLKTERRVRLGIKHAYDVFPGFLVARLKRERREAFDLAQQETEIALRRQIAECDLKHTAPNAEQRRFRDELDTRLAQLLEAGKSSEDPGPIYDCVVFRDGDVWRAAVDTDEDGDLAEEQPLTNFREERQHATFGGGAELNFAVNIYDDGDRLSLVFDSGAHATHVAAIFPTRPNGAASPRERRSFPSRSATPTCTAWKPARRSSAAWPRPSNTSAT